MKTRRRIPLSCLIGLTTSVPRWNILLTAASLMYTTIQSNHVAPGAAFLADPQVLSQDPGPFRRDLRISFFSIPVQPLATLMVNKPLHINASAHISQHPPLAPSSLHWHCRATESNPHAHPYFLFHSTLKSADRPRYTTTEIHSHLFFWGFYIYMWPLR